MRRSAECVFAIACAAFVPVVACAQATLSQRMSVRVQVEVYSGRPNPEWELSPDSAGQFLALFDALPAPASSEIPAPVEEGLGYRGVRVAVAAPGRVMQLVVAGRIVQVDTPGTARRRLADPDHALERWLLQSGAGHLDAELRDYLLRELSRDRD